MKTFLVAKRPLHECMFVCMYDRHGIIISLSAFRYSEFKLMLSLQMHVTSVYICTLYIHIYIYAILRR